MPCGTRGERARRTSAMNAWGAAWRRSHVTHTMDHPASRSRFQRRRSRSNALAEEWNARPSHSTATFASGKAMSAHRVAPAHWIGCGPSVGWKSADRRRLRARRSRIESESSSSSASHAWRALPRPRRPVRRSSRARRSGASSMPRCRACNASPSTRQTDSWPAMSTSVRATVVTGSESTVMRSVEPGRHDRCSWTPAAGRMTRSCGITTCTRDCPGSGLSNPCMTSAVA